MQLIKMREYLVPEVMIYRDPNAHFYIKIRLDVWIYAFLMSLNSCSRACKRGTLDPEKVKGHILVCLHEEKGYEAAKAGAVAMISGADGTFSASYGFLPVTKLNLKDFEAVLDYIKSTE